MPTTSANSGSMESSTAIVGVPHSETSSGPPPRQDSASNPHRAKRAKYAAVACDECKKRKLKCVRQDGRGDCQRCVSTGAPCSFSASASRILCRDAQTTNENPPMYQADSVKLQRLTEEMAVLRQQVAHLVGYMQTADAEVRRPAVQTPQHTGYSSPATTDDGADEPTQPHFVGHTRSAFSFRIAESSLSRMGFPTAREGGTPADTPRQLDRPFGSPPSTPAESGIFLQTFEVEEVRRLLGVYQDEIESVYPFIDTKQLAAKASNVLEYAKNQQTASGNSPDQTEVWKKDLIIISVATATGIMCETQGRNNASNKLVNSVRPYMGPFPSAVTASLQDMQIMTMLSIYYFHCGEELLAWRTIGIAARDALEMGLHRRQSLWENFQDPGIRNIATRAFWCVYALDRRWSFGTGLSFALNDRDIDPDLPEPGEDFPYLRCMVAYGRLCTRVWEALPSLGAPCQTIPRETVTFLDFATQSWLASIPQELQLRHPRLGAATYLQPKVLHRLRVLLYMRGNHMRTLIHRHHVLSPANIAADTVNAGLVVDIAKDSIQVLVHLNRTTDIYARQQSAFNYFLLSSLAIIFLAVCHAPEIFADPCRDAFLEAVELVKGFSRRSTATHRLWKSIRGLLPAMKTLSSRNGQQTTSSSSEAAASDKNTNQVYPWAGNPGHQVMQGTYEGTWNDPNVYNQESPNQSSVPDIFNMSTDLLNLFDAFGQPSAMQTMPHEPPGPYFDADGQEMPPVDSTEISRWFQGLI